MTRLCVLFTVVGWCLIPAPGLLADAVVINEFLAVGESGLTDEDGDPSDWLELSNTGPVDVDLSGWHLTDDPGDLEKWRFPVAVDLNLSPGAYLVVFASGKDRDSPAAEYHTNFALDGEGEYLALVQPDGITVEHEYAPTYPEQRQDISFGLFLETATLISPGAEAEVLVPADDALGSAWLDPDFAAGDTWTRGATGVGYDTSNGEANRGPTSFWRFDGDFRDAAGSHHATPHGGPSFVTDRNGEEDKALRFNGSDDYLEVEPQGGLPAYRNAAYTVAMWVRGDPQADKRVYSEGSSTNARPLLTIGTDNTAGSGAVDIFIRTDDGNTVVAHRKSRRVAFDGDWHHIAWVDDNGSAALFVDGVRDATDFNYQKPDLSIDVTSIGAVLRSSPCCYFAGSLDDAAVWDRALLPEEIAALAAGESPFDGSAFDPWIETDLGNTMPDFNASAYVRVPFDVEDPSSYDSLTLRMQYDDGFVAYLNGVEVARRNAPDDLRWNSAATVERETRDAIVPEAFDISAHLNALRAGVNVLAIHGLNVHATDSDFLVLPELIASSSGSVQGRYFRTPTPGARNDGGFVDFVVDTKFSVDRGFFEEPFEVEITTATPEAEIRYTIDGSAPTETTGEVYVGPLAIDTTTTLRAAAFKPGFEPTNVDTHTYIFLKDVIRQPNNPPGYPSTWAGLRADYAMDPEICTDTGSPHYQPTIKDDLKSIPTLSLVLDPDDWMGPSRGIYTHPLNRGRGWERAGSAELIYPDGSRDGFHVNCGIRMQGGSSARPVEGKHSYRLLFKSQYGPSKLRYKLFEDSPVEEFDTIILRCHSTDSWHFKDGGSRYRRWDSQYIRDLWMRDSQRAMGHPSSHGTYVHLYVNGLYWGLYNPSERPDDSFHAHHQGDEREDWDVVKDFQERFRGDLRSWSELMSLSSAGFTTRASYQRLQGNDPDGTPNPDYPVLLDVDNLIDYMMLHFFAGAEDWPHHNWYGARSRTGDLGGWRFFVWDQEIVLDFAYRNRVNVNNTGSPSFVYSRLRANPEFRVRFGDRVHKHLFHGGALTVEECQRRWLRRAEEIDRAIVGESARWGDFRQDVRDPSNSPATLYTREEHWVVEREKVLNEYLPEYHRRTLERLEAADLYPEVVAPEFNQHGGLIEPGFRLQMTAPEGTVYFTLDGTDPRLEGGGISPTAEAAGIGDITALVLSGASAKAYLPSDDRLGTAWIQPEFDDSDWRSGTTGVGFERSSGYEDLIGLAMPEADRVNATIYIRVAFSVEELGDFDSMILRMKYDDGFVAYLNGQEIARRNAPDTLSWDSDATAPHGDSRAVVFENMDVSEHLEALRLGDNMLAIHGLNSSPSSNDMLILPELIARRSSTGGVVLTSTTLVRARAHTGDWSALNEALFEVDRPLRITEIMYHPLGPPEGSPYLENDFEFIEIQNIGSEPFDLAGVRLIGGIEFDFTGSLVTRLAPGDLVVVVENLNAFASRYDAGSINIAGRYSGRLSNGGERLVLLGPLDERILDFAYDDAWHVETDGQGPSLVIVDPGGERGNWNVAEGWRPSRFLLGSPGIDESSEAPVGLQRPGDATQDGAADLSDAVNILAHLFLGRPAVLPCEGGTIDDPGNRRLLDVNDDGQVSLTDAVHLLNYLFQGDAPPALGTECVPIEGCPDACQPG